MGSIKFKSRVIAAMQAQDINKAELSRKSGVPYHTLDKFIKREDSTTSAENATSLENALGIKVDGDREYEELRSLYYQLGEAEQKFLLASVRGLLPKD